MLNSFEFFTFTLEKIYFPPISLNTLERRICLLKRYMLFHPNYQNILHYFHLHLNLVLSTFGTGSYILLNSRNDIRLRWLFHCNTELMDAFRKQLPIRLFSLYLFWLCQTTFQNKIPHKIIVLFRVLLYVS